MNHVTKKQAVIGSVIVGGLLIFSALFVVSEGKQVVVTQFGKPVRTVTDAGLYVKLPLVNDVRTFDKRILNWDGEPNQVPTRDKKFIMVDTTARWQIVDPLRFIQTVQSEAGAKSRLNAILDGATRDVISGHNLVDAVRNSNDLVEKVRSRGSNLASSGGGVDDVNAVDEEVFGEIEPVQIGREQLSAMIAERAKDDLAPLGIQLIDVQLRRIAYEASVQEKVFARMISERQRIAEKIRSIGQAEKARIEGKIARDLQTIESEGYRSAQDIRGQAEASAAALHVASVKKSPELYRLKRTLAAYENTVDEKSRLILTTDSEFWRLMGDKQ